MEELMFLKRGNNNGYRRRNKDDTHEDGYTEKPIELTVAKNNRGPTGVVPIACVPH